MATWRFVDFCVPEAQRLADLIGIEYDLRCATNYCDEFLKRKYPSDSMEEFQVLTALCVAAVVAYGRTFATGVRTGIKEEQLARLAVDMQERHAYFKDFRDKFVAHSVNALEENRVNVLLVPEERGSRAIASVGEQHGRIVTLPPDAMACLRELVAQLLVIVNVDKEAERARVLAHAQSLPVDPFYETGTASAINPTKAVVSKPRKQFPKSR